jgi:hypothetical protein
MSVNKDTLLLAADQWSHFLSSKSHNFCCIMGVLVPRIFPLWKFRASITVMLFIFYQGDSPSKQL